MSYPQSNYLDTAATQTDTTPSPLQVDVPLTSHEQIDVYVQPIVKDHISGVVHAMWVKNGLRLTFKDREQATNFRLRFKEPQ